MLTIVRRVLGRVADWLAAALFGGECDDGCVCPVCTLERRGVSW